MLDAARKVWPFDREPMEMGVEDGIVWAIVQAPSVGVNGYVLIPAEGHPWSPGFPRGEDSDEQAKHSMEHLRKLHEIMQRKPKFDEAWQELAEQDEDYPHYTLDDFVDVHGGTTYYQHPWVGFDTAHAWDVWDEEYDPHGITNRPRYRDDDWVREWTPELVVEEAKSLARQIAEIGHLEKRLEIQEESRECDAGLT